MKWSDNEQHSKSKGKIQNRNKANTNLHKNHLLKKRMFQTNLKNARYCLFVFITNLQGEKFCLKQNFYFLTTVDRNMTRDLFSSQKHVVSSMSFMSFVKRHSNVVDNNKKPAMKHNKNKTAHIVTIPVK